MYEHKFYAIETLTNMHMGSGDSNLGDVDKLIQKDPVTNIPVFHPSSIKGALREHMKQVLPSKDIVNIFGGEEGKENNNAPGPGNVKFYEARLLTLPLRSSSRVYYNGTSLDLLRDFINSLIIFKKGQSLELNKLNSLFSTIDTELKGKDFVVLNDDKCEVEDYTNYKKLSDNSLPEVEKLLGKYIYTSNLAIFNDLTFKSICEDSLPVIARNNIDENGISQNLFYEEILPRRTKMWLMLGFDRNVSINNDFEKILTKEVIQMGANASIGYGVTKTEEFSI